MKRFWGRALAAATIIALPAVFVPACAHDDTTLFIYDVLAQQLVSPGASCTFTSSATQPFITGGTLDIDLASSYFGNFLLANQMIQQANPNAPKTETSFIQVQGAVVTVKDASGNQVLAQYTVNAASTVPPATGGTPGFAPISGIPLVRSDTVGKYGGDGVRFLTFTHFFGVTLGGQSVTSNEYEFPVDLCEGCLIEFLASEDVLGVQPQPNCAGAAQAMPMSEPCIPGQDLPLNCAFCLGNVDCNPQVTSSVQAMQDAGQADSSTPGNPTPDAAAVSDAASTDGSVASDGVAPDSSDGSIDDGSLDDAADASAD